MSTLLNILERFVVVVSEKCKDILARGKQQTSKDFTGLHNRDFKFLQNFQRL
jgi:hypothetical protein